MTLHFAHFLSKGHHMNTIRKSILIGMTVLGLGATSLSAQAHQGSHGEAATGEQRHAQWAEKAAARHQKLHDALKLTASQEAAWNTYLAARKPAQRGQRPDRAAWKAMPAPQRMEQRIALAKERTAAMETRLAALNSFYAVLTPEQKKVFDESAMQGGGHRRGHHMQHHRMGA
jgi:periplasmic protein CpxP/Spy